VALLPSRFFRWVTRQGVALCTQLWADMNAPSARAVARAPARERSSKGRRSKKAQKLLSQIFGADQAAALCRSAAAARSAAAPASSGARPVRVPRKTAVTEVVKFAGQTIECVVSPPYPRANGR
jgi:hypothetical protein